MSQFQIPITVTRNGSPLKGIRLTYEWDDSNCTYDTWPDVTGRNGVAVTDWDYDCKNKDVKIYCNGKYQTTIRVRPRLEPRIELNRSGCFPSDAQVLTPAGYRKISDLSKGDRVVSFSAENGCTEECEILKVSKHRPSRICRIEFRSGTPMFVTEAHSLLTARGFAAVHRLLAGDLLLAAEAGKQDRTIKRITVSNRVEPVYNLVTSGHFSFIVDGTVAHNFTKLVRLRCLCWTIFHRLSNIVIFLFARFPSSLDQKG